MKVSGDQAEMVTGVDGNVSHSGLTITVEDQYGDRKMTMMKEEFQYLVSEAPEEWVEEAMEE